MYWLKRKEGGEIKKKIDMGEVCVNDFEEDGILRTRSLVRGRQGDWYLFYSFEFVRRVSNPELVPGDENSF